MVASPYVAYVGYSEILVPYMALSQYTLKRKSDFGYLSVLSFFSVDQYGQLNVREMAASPREAIRRLSRNSSFKHDSDRDM